jgi:DNA replicative helicase MCM subunit Mcm2 (Cdc46/Mcm family)
LVVYDDLVDECKPGDELEIIGIYRGESNLIKKNQSKLDPILTSYIDVVSVVFPHKNKIVLNND